MSEVLRDVLGAFILFLPAGMANMSPVIANKIPGLSKWTTPMDFGMKWRGKRILGDNKTWRGVVFGTFMASLVGLVQYPILLKTDRDIPILIGFSLASGALMGLGALLGDAVESFFKRRLAVDPGGSWFPFDQIDYIIGGLLLSWPLIHWNLREALFVFVVYFGLHLLFAYFGYLLGLKDRPI